MENRRLDVARAFLPAVSPFVATSSRTDNRVCADADRNVGAAGRPPGSLRPAPSLDEKCYLCPGLLRRGFQRIGVGYEASAMSIGEKGAGRRPLPLNPRGPRSNGSYLPLGEVVPSTRIPIPTGSGSSPLQEKIGETEPRSPITRPTREVQSFSPEELDRRPGGAAESRVTRRALSALRGDARRSVFATPGLSAREHLS